MNHGKTKIAIILRMRVTGAILCLGTLFIPSHKVQSQIPQVTPLPLSGRAGQSGSVTAVESPIAGTTTSVDTINPTVQTQGAFTGSASSTAKMPFSDKLSLREAIARGLNYNLGTVGQSDAVRQAEGQSQVARSALLPNASGYLAETIQQISLGAEGLRITIPGFTIPPTIGPFNNMDLRGSLTQSIVDLSAWNNYRSSRDVFRASQFAERDAREMVVLAVCGAYLQVIATEERVKSAHAQLDTATALFEQTQQKRSVGLAPQIDVDRSEVEELTQQQRVISLENEVAKQKIILARITGLPPSDEYELTDDVPFLVAPDLSLEDALEQAFEHRTDIKAAEAQVHAAEHTLAAARDERFPSLTVNGNYGGIGTNPPQMHTTYFGAATLNVPIWLGGRTEGEITEAKATLAQRRAELEDTRSLVESDVRNAYLDLRAATSQVEVARRNLRVTRETLELTRQRFDAGVTDNVEVVQAQESLTSAELDVINSVFAHNVAKLSLARSIASAADGLREFLSLQ
jgi:outer membrane protein TolC